MKQLLVVLGALVVSSTASGCKGPVGEGHIETYTLATGWGVRYDLVVDTDTNSYEFTPVGSPDGKFTLDCPTKGPRFGTLQCVISVTDDPVNSPVGSQLMLVHFPDLAWGIANPPMNGDAERLPGGISPLWQVNTNCAETLSGLFTKVGFSQQGTFSALQMDLSNQLVRHADFAFLSDGTGFKTVYSTKTGGGTGLENVTNHVCDAGGHHKVSLIDNGQGYYFDLVQTTSEILVYSQLELAASRVASLSELAGKTFTGVFMDSKNTDGTDQVKITFGNVNSGTIAITKFESTESATFPSGLKAGQILAAVSNPLAGNRFASAVGSTNSLRTTYAKASDIPGMYYLNVPDASGNEQPLSIAALKTKQGKIVLSGMLNGRSGVTYSPTARMFAVEN